MKRRHSGFTLIEVSLFLAITGLLFVGIAAGTQNSIFQQRFNDAVQNFADFLRSAYSEVTNVRNDGKGVSDQAIYGKLITFGETTDLAGKDIEAGTAVFSYNVVANAEGAGAGNVIDTLKSLGATVVVEDGEGVFKPAGYADDYRPRWSSAIQETRDKGDNPKESFTGALLIVRHPDSGTIYTFVKEGETIQVNRTLRDNSSKAGELLSGVLDSFKNDGPDPIDFCINPNGIGQGGLRRDVRLVVNARNSSGVEIIGDGEDDECGQVD